MNFFINIQNFLSLIETKRVIGEITNKLATDLSSNSKKIDSKTIFVAIKGTNTDGHLYINDAIENGAQIIICETIPSRILEKVLYIEVENSKKSLLDLLNFAYQKPYKK